MPPRPRQTQLIALAPPSNGANPITTADYDHDLPVRFSGSARVWCKYLSFLPWAHEVVAPGAPITYSDVSFFALEDILLGVIHFEAASSPIHSSYNTTFLNALLASLAQHSIGLSASRDEYDTIRKWKKGFAALSSTELEFLKVKNTHIMPFALMVAPFTGEAAWLNGLSWAKLNSDLPASKPFLNSLGFRATLASRSEAGGRLVIMASQIKTAFTRVFDGFTLSNALLTTQIPTWYYNLKWPSALNIPAASLDSAITEFLRVFRYETSTPNEKALLISEVFDRVLVRCPALSEVAGSATPKQCYNAFRSMLATFKIPSDPVFEDWAALDLKVQSIVHLVSSIGNGADLLGARVAELEKEERLSNKTSKGNNADADATGKAAGSSGVHQSWPVNSTSLNSLRRSPQLQTLVEQLNTEMDKSAPEQLVIIRLCMKSRLSAVVRFICGAISSLDVADVFTRITHFRARKLHKDSLAAIAKWLWLDVFSEEIVECPRVGLSTFPSSFVLELLIGKWTDIDFEQHLITNLDLARTCATYDAEHKRPKSVWFTDETLLADLVVPFSSLMCCLGQGETPALAALANNSAAAVFNDTIEGYKHARRNEITASSMTARARETLIKSMQEAQEAWSAFFSDVSAVAPFPVSWLPLSSTANAGLEATRKAATTFMDWQADLGEVLQSPSPSKTTAKLQNLTPTKQTVKREAEDVEEVSKLRAELKKLKRELKKGF